jgi:hypothetical protein
MKPMPIALTADMTFVKSGERPEDRRSRRRGRHQEG